MQQNWYQLKLLLHPIDRKNITVIFPRSPLDFLPVGKQVHEYLEQNGFIIITVKDKPTASRLLGQNLLTQNATYIYEYRKTSVDPDLARKNAIALYEKFKAAGAQLIYKDVSDEYVTKAEFEALKKKSATVLQQLKSLELELPSSIDRA